MADLLSLAVPLYLGDHERILDTASADDIRCFQLQLAEAGLSTAIVTGS